MVDSTMFAKACEESKQILCKLDTFCYNAHMQQPQMLDLKNIAILETDDGLDKMWLTLSFENRLRIHLEILQRGIKLEEAIKGVSISHRMDKTVHYNILEDAF